MGKKRQGSLRERIESRAGSRCEYCRAPQTACGYRFHLEHIVPSAKDGSDDIDNRALACAACNLAKSDRTVGLDLDSGRAVAIFDPRTQLWSEHFRWRVDQKVLIGLTPVGRATVIALNLNDQMRLDARKLWFDAGLLP